jgi:integrase/recombinase XerD
MAQAKTLSDKELKIVLATIAQGRHAERNRAMVLMSMWAGMRVGEIAALRNYNVLNPDGSIKDRIELLPEQTKGKERRTVFLGERLRKELAVYARTQNAPAPDAPFFRSQRRRVGFTANALCQLIAQLYERAGIDGASSHSGRRTFITTLANRGVGVRVIMSLAGHRNMSTTQRYIDLNDQIILTALEIF